MNFRRDEKLYQPYFNPKWNKCILYELVDWFNGFAFKSSHFSEKGKPIIKIAELKNGITEQTKFTDQEFDKVILVKKGNLLFSWSGQPEKSIDVFWWKGPEGWLNQHIFKVIPKNCDKKFLYYLLKYVRPNFIDIARNKQTTGLGHVTKKDLQRIIVGFPPLPEQRAIAHILDTLDDKIELNRRMNETLEEMAKAIFKSWFVDFDPVIDNALKAGNPIPDALVEKATCRRAILKKLEKEDPNLPKLFPEIARLFPDSFEDSPLGPIPKGWRISYFTEVIEINPKYSLSKGKIAPYVDMASLPTSGLELLSPPKLREFTSGSKFKNGDVLFARITPCLENGKTTLVNFLEEDQVGWGSTEFLVFSPKRAGSYFIYCLSRWEKLRDFAVKTMKGTSGRKRVSKEAFEHFYIPEAPSEILIQFEKTVDPLFLKIKSNNKESQTLSAVRDTLLPKLISGQIRIKDAEKSLEGKSYNERSSQS